MGNHPHLRLPTHTLPCLHCKLVGLYADPWASKFPSRLLILLWVNEDRSIGSRYIIRTWPTEMEFQSARFQRPQSKFPKAMRILVEQHVCTSTHNHILALFNSPPASQIQVQISAKLNISSGASTMIPTLKHGGSDCHNVLEILTPTNQTQMIYTVGGSQWLLEFFTD